MKALESPPQLRFGVRRGQHHPVIGSTGLAYVKIVGDDMNGPPADMWKIEEQAVADPELAKCLCAVGVHYPHDDRWNDIEISAEGSFESLSDDAHGRGERFIGVLARWYPGATWIHFTTPQPAGYCFRLFGDGRWDLTTARKVLARSTTAAPGTCWHTLRLRCVDDRIVASLDGTTIAQVRDSTYQRGLVGLVSRFHPARFDTLTIDVPRAD